jgi:chromosome partitioning protein
MKPTVITTSQRKGGVGKSTSTLNLAHVIAEAGRRVLIIDLDDQQNTTRSISALVTE